MDNKFLSARNFLNDWINTVWGKKLGIVVIFCHVIQRGIFVSFFRNKNMQECVLEKAF